MSDYTRYERAEISGWPRWSKVRLYLVTTRPSGGSGIVSPPSLFVSARRILTAIPADEKIEANLREALDQGFRHFKLKVGIDLEGDKRRLGMIRRVAGDDVVIMVSIAEAKGVYRI